MIVAIILLGSLLIISIIFNLFLFRATRVLLNQIAENDNIAEEIAFMQGDYDIPEEEILNIYPNAILLCSLAKNSLNNDTLKITDISNYPKNHIIGLTYLVQPQLFEDIRKDFNSPQIRERLKQSIIDEQGLDPEEVDTEFLDEVIEESIQETFGEYDENGTLTKPLMRNCTVYQLKDGRWLWRSE